MQRQYCILRYFIIILYRLDFPDTAQHYNDRRKCNHGNAKFLVFAKPMSLENLYEYGMHMMLRTVYGVPKS